MTIWRSISWGSGLFSATWRARNAAAEANRSRSQDEWWDMMGLGDMGLASFVRTRCVYGVNAAWTQLRWCTVHWVHWVHWVHCPFSASAAGHSPSRIGPGISQILLTSWHVNINFQPGRGVLRCQCPSDWTASQPIVRWNNSFTMTPCCGCWFWSSKYGSS